MALSVDPEILASIPQQAGVQDSVYDQLVTLYVVAIRLGLFDAADYVQRLIESTKKST